MERSFHDLIVEWKGYVSQALEHFSKDIGELKESLDKCRENMQVLKSGFDSFAGHAVRKYDCERKCGEFERRLDDLQRSLSVTETAFKIKSGFWGIVGGAIPATVTVLLILLKWLLSHNTGG